MFVGAGLLLIALRVSSVEDSLCCDRNRSQLSCVSPCQKAGEVGSCLNGLPPDNGIRDRHFVNVAPFQFGGEVARVHGGDGAGDSVV